MNMTCPKSPPPDGNQNRTGELIGICIGFLVVSFIVVTLRLYTRLILIKSARWDDWTIFVALVRTELLYRAQKYNTNLN